jgi:hypothetical protein
MKPLLLGLPFTMLPVLGVTSTLCACVAGGMCESVLLSLQCMVLNTIHVVYRTLLYCVRYIYIYIYIYNCTTYSMKCVHKIMHQVCHPFSCPHPPPEPLQLLPRHRLRKAWPGFRPGTDKAVAASNLKRSNHFRSGLGPSRLRSTVARLLGPGSTQRRPMCRHTDLDALAYSVGCW